MSSLLEVPYYSQRSNFLNPSGVYNIAALSMVLAACKGEEKANGTTRQIAEFLSYHCNKHGVSRHSVAGLQELIRIYNDRRAKSGGKPISYDFLSDASLQDIRDALDLNQACLVHSHATIYGHLLVMRGWKERTFICNDPAGAWTPWTYIRENGAGVAYSDRMVAACCSAFSYGEAMTLYEKLTQKEIDATQGIWLHRISLSN